MPNIEQGTEEARSEVFHPWIFVISCSIFCGSAHTVWRPSSSGVPMPELLGPNAFLPTRFRIHAGVKGDLIEMFDVLQRIEGHLL